MSASEGVEELGPEEVSAGCVVLSNSPTGQRVALIMRREREYELPKVRGAGSLAQRGSLGNWEFVWASGLQTVPSQSFSGGSAFLLSRFRMSHASR